MPMYLFSYFYVSSFSIVLSDSQSIPSVVAYPPLEETVLVLPRTRPQVTRSMFFELAGPEVAEDTQREAFHKEADLEKMKIKTMTGLVRKVTYRGTSDSVRGAMYVSVNL